jgi:hypothetical protein
MRGEAMQNWQSLLFLPRFYRNMIAADAALRDNTRDCRRNRDMLLYVCKVCGKWCDGTLSEALSRAFSAFTAAFSVKEETTPPQQSYPCPDGHGAMSLVSTKERLFVWNPESTGRPVLLRPIKEKPEGA